MTTTEAKNFLTSLESIPMTANDAPPELINKLNEAMKALREDKTVWFSTTDLPHEIWREVEDYIGDYLVSIFGRIKSIKYPIQRVLKQCTGVRGYQLIELSKDNVQKHYRVHRLVANAFLPNLTNKEQVNHLFGVASNAVWQIEWVTGKENVQHAVNIGLCKSGADLYNAKLTNEQVEEILSLYVKGSKDFGSVALGKRFGVSHNQILRVIHGRTYKKVGGERHAPSSRKAAKTLTPEEKEIIRTRYKKGVMGCGSSTLAKLFNVDNKTILKIVKEGD